MALHADLALSVVISRDSLGLGPLEIANTPDYYLSPQFLGASVEWDRKQVSSQWVDGDVTVARRRKTVTERIGVEVIGHSQSTLRTLIDALIDAFVQDSYTMTVTASGATYVYACEAADYQDMTWNTPRMVASQGQIVFSVPRQPLALAGGY